MEDRGSSAVSTALIRYVCASDAHNAVGRSVPDGQGVITIHLGAWAYCPSTRLAEPHEWRETLGRTIQAMRHARGTGVGLPVAPAGSVAKRRGTGTSR
jgi:hypothetical protein